ncbi:hypothetical protein CBF68_06710 [Lactobacillus taiwanensis]|nr:hypothetical protein CBF64_02220 [Lactobacillus taiwanensis]OYS03329.1 hypothetical protein CBF68_06710 [Lactobacillus taiwanensis]
MGLGTSACSSQTNNSIKQTTTSKSKKSVEKTDGKAYGGNFQDSKGYIAIENVTNVTVKGSDGDDHYALVQGTFSNNDKESVAPTSFFSNHLKVMEKVGKATHDLVLVTTDIENELTPWENQIKEGRKKVEPNMTGNFVIVYKLDLANGAKTNATHYVFEPYDSRFGKSLTVKVYESKTIKKSSDNAGSNSHSDESTDTNSSADTSSDTDVDTDD